MTSVWKTIIIATLTMLSFTSHAHIGNFGITDSAVLCHMSAVKAHSLTLGRGPLLVGNTHTVFTRVLTSGEEVGMARSVFLGSLLVSSSTDAWDAGTNALRARGPQGTFFMRLAIPSQPGQKNTERVDAFVRSSNRQAGKPEPVGLQTDSCIIYYEDLVELANTRPALVIREN